MAASTRLLAERAGVAPGVVHYHFASLRALLIEAAIGRMREFRDGLFALTEQANTPENAVRRLARSLDEFTGRDPASLLFTETYLAATRDDQLGGGMVDVVAAFDGVLMHRGPDAELTASAVTPVSRRLVGAG